MTTTIYGIKNCDTMKKALTWLDAKGVKYRFHDYKVEGIDTDTLTKWIAELGWEALLNRSGTTFRKLSDTDKRGMDASKALRFMQAQPSLIKRPVLDLGDRRVVGFKPDLYSREIAKGGK